MSATLMETIGNNKRTRRVIMKYKLHRKTARLKALLMTMNPNIPPNIPLPRQIKSVVTQALLNGIKLGSTTAETAQIIKKYAAPANIPQINL